MKSIVNISYGFLVLFMILVFSGVAVYSQLPSDVDRGLKYFSGDLGLENGGPACISCHSISSLDIKGGTVGPDLSRVLEKGEFTNFGGDVSKLKEFLSNPTTPTMRGIFSTSPLTSDEINALASLLEYALSKAPAKPVAEYGPPIYELLFASAAVVGLIVALLAYVYVLRRGG